MKRYLVSILAGIILVAGILLMLYPVISNCWNSLHQSRAIAAYAGKVQSIEETDYKAIWDDAAAYNKSLVCQKGARTLNEQELALYNSLLNPGGDGIMGYLEIPSINVYLPVYHGTEEAVLQIAAGHVEWSSLPVGGEGSHCVFSGHRGLPSARLFTDLDQLQIGDQIILNIMDESLIYEVDQIVIAEPSETEELKIQAGKDLCTLITCTPYGINTHRLLVRGERTGEKIEKQTIRIAADAIKVQIPIRWPAVMICIAVVSMGLVKGIQFIHRFWKGKRKSPVI